MRLIAPTLLAAACLAASPISATPLPTGAPVADLVRAIDIPYSQFTLANGLKVVVHSDHKAPVVAIAVWYHVGSKDEPAGRTGFAHLFEHLMFGGSEHSDQSWFKPMQEIGATDLNGTTYFDRTNYFETVPRGALERALFLESDRMGHLLGAVTQAKLDMQRGVVENEKRQGDSAPGGMVKYAMFQTLFPDGSPYHHLPIGAMADLDVASLDDVKGWFRSHYGPNNAVLVLAGDITAQEARSLVERYFGDIPRGPQPAPTPVKVPTLAAPVSRAFTDQVANISIARIWTIPGETSPDTPALDLTAWVLGGLGSSRLDNALVRDRKVAVSVSAGVGTLEGAGTFSVSATVRPGVDPAEVGRALDAVVADFLAHGPTLAELDRARMQAIAGTIHGLESVGGFGGKATTLASGLTYAGDPGFYKIQLARRAALTPEDVTTVARRWLSRPAFSYTLSPGPRGAYEEAAGVVGGATATRPATPAAPVGTTARSGVDRMQLPPIGAIADLTLPPVERATLANGIPVILSHRDAVPTIDLAFQFDAGNAADPRDKLGTQSLMLALLGQGTDRYDATQVEEAKETLGMGLSAGPSMDRTTVFLSALAPNLAPSIDLAADVIRRSSFAPAEIERLRALQLARIAAETKQPESLAMRLLPPLLYGQDHPYGVPFSGTGDAVAVKAVTRDDLIAFQTRWLRPDTLRIFVAGDTTLDRILPLLQASFGDWGAAGPRPAKPVETAIPKPAPRILLIDKPGSPQSLILAGEVLPLSGTDDLLALIQAEDVLGDSFLSRLNSDLRETRHWAYGVTGEATRLIGRMPYIVYAPVQADKTGPAIAALRDDMRAYLGPNGTTPEELARTIAGSVLALPGQFETSNALLGAMITNDTYHRPDDYYTKISGRLRALTTADLDTAARRAIDPDALTWIVVGDKAKVVDQLKPLGLPIEVRDMAPVSTTAPHAED